MKQKLAKYILFVYLNYIQEDMSNLKPFAQKLLKSAWFIKSILIWICSIIFFPLVLLDMHIQKNQTKIIKFLKNHL